MPNWKEAYMEAASEINSLTEERDAFELQVIKLKAEVDEIRMLLRTAGASEAKEASRETKSGPE